MVSVCLSNPDYAKDLEGFALNFDILLLQRRLHCVIASRGFSTQLNYFNKASFFNARHSIVIGLKHYTNLDTSSPNTSVKLYI